MDVPADATGVVGECTGAGALRLPGSPALAVLVMYCRMVVVGGDNYGMQSMCLPIIDSEYYI